MHLTVICQSFNELKKGNLIRFLDSIRRYADALVIYDDGSEDGTKQYLLDFTSKSKRDWDCALVGYESPNFSPSRLNPKDIHIIGSQSNDFKNEIFHKNALLEKAISIQSDWILWLDVDEVVEFFKEQEIRKLCEDKTIDAYVFPQINLWRSDRFYRVDNQYGDGYFTRLWRNNGKLHYKPESGLHQRQYPFGIDKVRDTTIKIIHYGFATDQSILDKYRTYEAHGQSGWALNRLVDENGLKLKHTDPKWLSHDFNGPELLTEAIAAKL